MADSTSSKKGKERLWAPHIWEGCDFFAWWRLLVRNRFAVHWSCLYVAVVVTFVSVFNLVLRFIQDAFYGRDIRRTPIRHPPIFILGHWRTGTTLLHELLIQDDRHGYPTTYECLEPNHFLITEGFLTKWLKFLVPSRRPMDNMKAGFDRPQEDEFALCMIGQHSPYNTIAFPNRGPADEEYLDLEGVTPRDLAAWKRDFHRFLQTITFKQRLRLVLKSPPHTARIKVLKEMFPDAVFIHIVRNPYVVFPSTVNLWKSLYRAHGLQKPNFHGLEEYVYHTFERMYAKLEETRHLVAPERFYELRYEDLTRDPAGEMHKLYDHLGLGEFDRVLPRLQQYLASVKGYETNKYQLTAEQRAEIRRRWGHVIDRYGYAHDEPALARAAG
jgi:omega-hydroxy-beta-dihydromenaquinone-9 sulfotransferase